MSDPDDLFPSTSSETTETTSTFAHRIRWERVAVAVIGSYYLAKLLYFALSVAPGVPPDETTHLELIRLYARTRLFVEDSPASYQWGLVTHVPYFYHLLFGKLLTLNLFGIEDYRFLRLANVGLGMLTFGACYGLARETSAGVLTRLLFLVMITNTLMFTFISAAISYDNLVNLLAVISLWMLTRFLRTGDPASLLGCLAAMGLGSITKTSFLPIVPTIALVILWLRRGTLRSDAGSILKALKSRSPAAWILSVLVAISFSGALLLYGGNLFRFQKPVPACDEVLGLDQCMQNRIFARNRILALYRTNEIDLRQAMLESGSIAHSGDRDHLLRLIENERRYKSNPTPPLNRFDYLLLAWDRALKPTMFGIQAHHSMLKSANQTVAYEIILVAAILLTVRLIRRSDQDWLVLSSVSGVYILFLVCFYNYAGYVQSHAPFLGVQGRYLFPVLAPVFLISSEFVLRPFRGQWKLLPVVVIATVFVAGELPYFRSHASPPWFSPAATRIEKTLEGLS